MFREYKKKIPKLQEKAVFLELKAVEKSLREHGVKVRSRQNFYSLKEGESKSEARA